MFSISKEDYSKFYFEIFGELPGKDILKRKFESEQDSATRFVARKHFKENCEESEEQIELAGDSSNDCYDLPQLKIEKGEKEKEIKESSPPQPRKVKWVSWNKFEKKLLEPASREISYPQRFNRAQEYCTKKNERSAVIYVALDKAKDLHLKILFKVKPYHSAALREDYFLEADKKENQSHHFIEIYECDPEVRGGRAATRIVQLRTTRLGSRSELTCIQKGERICGNRALELALHLAEKILKGTELDLYDDSRKPLEIAKGTRGKKAKLYNVAMRKLRPLSNDDGLTWYEAKAGVKAVDLQQYHTCWDHISQSHEGFHQAITTVRDTPLSLINETHASIAFSLSLTKRLAKKYLPDEERSTIGTLVQKMNNLARCADESRRRATVEKDIALFFKYVIDVWNLPTDHLSQEGKELIDGLEVLQETRIFRKVL